MSSPVLVGREEDLARLEDAFAAAREGEPGVVLVGGDAGIGKTRLVTEFTGRLDGSTVLVGGCIELGAEVLPHAPLAEVVRGLARSRGEDGLLRLLTGPGRALRRLLPGGAPTERADIRGGPRSADLYDAALALLQVLSGEGPVVLVVEDVHWAAPSTLDLVSYLARGLTVEPVLVVVTFRSDELHRRHALRPVLAELGRLPLVDRVDLEPLDEGTVAELVAGIVGHAPDAGVLERITARSEGNAFYAEELVAAAQTDATRLPTTVREVLRERLEALPEDAVEVLRVAAAAGREVDHALLVEVADLPVRQLRAGLRAAVAQGVLLTEPGSSLYRFRHALLQEAVHDDLLPGERTRLHAAVADALTARPELAVDGREGADGEIAHHAHEAGQLDRAYHASVRAAHRAQDQLAFREAQRHFERALALWATVSDDARVSGPDRSELVRGAARATTMSGDGSRAVAQLRAGLADDTLTGEQRFALLEQMAVALWLDGRTDDAVAAAAEAVDATDEATPARAAALAVLSIQLLLAGAPREAVERGRAALAAAREAGGSLELLKASLSAGTALGLLDATDEGEALLREAIGIAPTVDQGTPWAIRAHINLSSLLAGASRYDEAEQVALEGLQVADESGYAGHEPDFLRLNLVDVLVDGGRIADAEGHLRLVRRRPGSTALMAHFTVTAGNLRIARARFDDAADLIDATREDLGSRIGSQFRVPLATVGAALALARGDHDAAWDALAVLRQAGLFLVGDPTEPVRPLAARIEADRVATGTADAAAVDRARQRLAGLRDELDEALAAEATDSRWARVLRTAIAQVAAEATRVDGVADPDAWQRAEEGMVARGRVLDVAYLRIRRAEALVGRDRRDEATEVLRAVHGECVERGLVWLADQAEALARRARISLPGMAGADEDPFGLTPREREVLALVARGLTNPQIGERLFIAGKTASVHVSNILSKLGAATRGEAAAIAREHGLDGAPPTSPG